MEKEVKMRRYKIISYYMKIKGEEHAQDKTY